jgi:cellulose synthase/poly-beta-1,6-N-acetylglucosamine synthase-like glycosyltransferase
MSTVLLVVFWLSLASLLYVYGGFPLLVMLAGKVLDRTVRKQPVTPRLSLIIAAYNEEEGIADRLDNALAVDYPRESLEILVASDGSSDATGTIVGRYAARGVRLLSLPRRGKIPALTDAVQEATGEILVFSDANTVFQPDALRALARNFADPTVGGVAGNTSYRVEAGSESSSRGENSYWQYDTWLKQLESRTGSVVSAHGGLYAVRRELFQPPVDPAVTDDFIISTAVVEQGYRLVFEPEAQAWEVAVPETTREFRRRVRLMTRGLRAVAQRRRLLNPARYGFYSVVLFSHKVLRRLLPLALVALFVSSLYLASGDGFYLAAAIGQVLFYGVAGVGYLTRTMVVGRRKILYVPFFYCMASAAALLALLNFARGERIAFWQPQRHATGA